MSDRPYPTSQAEAEQFDAADPIAHARSRFDLPEGSVYLVGHSLGPPPRTALRQLQQTAGQDWAMGLVGSWNRADWINFPARLGAKLARLIGVDASDVTVCDSVSVNLFKLVGALIQDSPQTRTVLVESGEFPTDQYILERLAEMTGAKFLRSDPGQSTDHLGTGVILVRSLVDYRTGAIAPVAKLESQARQVGAEIVWDLSHATGVLDLTLSDWGVRYAVGCTYKYLNGGPGAPAFLYVASDHIDTLQTPIAGWLGHARPFAFDPHYDPAAGVQRFVAGTPPILSLASLSGALDAFEGLDLADVQNKAQTLGDMCLNAFARLDLSSVSPPVGQARGGHVSFDHPDGYAISRALAETGCQTDFRTPFTVRFGLSPLFLRYQDVWH
ncbi:MAG: aminotransferase class V-fold PLP-dependent enzyme, partial [Pseudomonadota bacterium]